MVRVVSTAQEEDVRVGSVFGPADDQYEVERELGSGAAAKVYACRRLSTGESLAVKAIDLKRLRLLDNCDGHLQRLDREVSILRRLKHERIVDLRAVHRTDNWYFLVMERVHGGELFSRIVNQGCLPEPEARHIFRQILEGVSYMHSRKVIHRDLKPENILIVESRSAPRGFPESGRTDQEDASSDEGANGDFMYHDVKIADFGLSKVISDNTSMAKTFVGTPQYWAPEVVRVQRAGGSYGQEADLWGIGAVLYVMLAGRYPFDGRQVPIEQQIEQGNFSLRGARWRDVSEEAKDLIRQLLRVNPSDRLPLRDCLRHPWVQGHGASRADSLEFPPSTPSPRPASSSRSTTPQERSTSPRSRPAREGGQRKDKEAARNSKLMPPPLGRQQGGRDGKREASSRSGSHDRLGSSRASSRKSKSGSPKTSHLDDTGSWGYKSASVDSQRSRRGHGRGSRAAAPEEETDGEDFDASEESFGNSSSSGEAVSRASSSRGSRGSRGSRTKSAGSGCSVETVPPGKAAEARAKRKSSSAWIPWSGFALGSLGMAFVGLLGWLLFLRQPQEMEGPGRPSTALATTPPAAASVLPMGMRDIATTTPAPFHQCPNFFGSHLVNLPSVEGTAFSLLMPPGLAPAEDEETQTGGRARSKSGSCQEQQDAMSRLRDLLWLQTSITGSLEAAALAVRHVDAELAEYVRSTHDQAIELFQKASELVSKYGQLAQHVSDSVLPDLQLAVQEQAPELALSLLINVKSWVKEMQHVGENIQPKYDSLQHSVLNISRQTGRIKAWADERLAQAAVEAAEEAAAACAADAGGDGASVAPTAAPAAVGSWLAERKQRWLAAGPALAPAVGRLTQDLFSDLLEHVPETGSALAAESEDATAAGAVASTVQAAASRTSAAGSAAQTGRAAVGQMMDWEWRQDVMDLIFTMPNDQQKVLPGLPEPAAFTNTTVTGATVSSSATTADVAGEVSASHGLPEATPGSGTASAMPAVLYNKKEQHSRKAAKTAASLNRALRELRRVGAILQGCSAFWANLDNTWTTLSQMKEHTEAFLLHSHSSPRLQERFYRQVEEYAGWWRNLGTMCQGYVAAHQARTGYMQKLVHKIRDVAEVVDSTTGVALALERAAATRHVTGTSLTTTAMAPEEVFMPGSGQMDMSDGNADADAEADEADVAINM
eukprot:TRINITY_DN92461_c0_g1_i1.p1 TRINITY_DN92461_c0_g1~~TRINITY_DN92461_c0_g1_i1.p1  ORF type:complete len:1191 (+),score=230.61 TRINITY_DN92461_c0_g1_i1:59-3574(+)